MSAKRDLFLCIKEKLCSITDENGQPLLKHVSRWNSQTGNLDQERSYQTPAAFIGFGSIEWERTNQKSYQEGRLIVTIYTQINSLKNEDKELRDFEVSDAIYAELQNFSGDFFSTLNRISERPDENHDGVIVWESDYETTLTDAGADEDRNKTPIAVTLVVEKELDVDDPVIRTGDGDFS